MGCGVRAEGAMRGVGCARLRRAGAGESGAERGAAEGRGRGARAAARDSIADGTALRCGRVGSRHFRRHRGFIPRGLFVYVATRHRRSVLPLSEGAASAEDGNSPPSTLPAFYLSVKKRNFAEQRHRREIYRTPYWGKEKNTDIDRERSEIIDRA